MPIITKRPKHILKSVTIKLPEPLCDRLKLYAQYTNLNQSEIAATAIEYAIASDKQFGNTNGNTTPLSTVPPRQAKSA